MSTGSGSFDKVGGIFLRFRIQKGFTSIEEFKNKKYRYQLTDYSVEIERMVIRLENLSIEGGVFGTNFIREDQKQPFRDLGYFKRR